jgi:hypothetical protein
VLAEDSRKKQQQTLLTNHRRNGGACWLTWAKTALGDTMPSFHRNTRHPNLSEPNRPIWLTLCIALFRAMASEVASRSFCFCSSCPFTVSEMASPCAKARHV